MNQIFRIPLVNSSLAIGNLKSKITTVRLNLE